MKRYHYEPDSDCWRQQRAMRHEMFEHPILTGPETYALGLCARVGSARAVQTLVRYNLRLVRSVIEREFPWRSRVPFEDLVQEGVVGLSVAVETWDPERARLSTHAWGWIRAHVASFLRGARSVVRQPRGAEVEADESLSESAVRKKIEAVEDPRAGPEAICEASELRERVEKIRPLIEAEHGALGWDVVWDHYLGQPPATLAALGARYGVSRQYVRKIKRKVLDLLRETLGVETMQPAELPPTRRRRREPAAAPEGVATAQQEAVAV